MPDSLIDRLPPSAKRISVVVPSYNSWRTIERVVDSLIAQPERYISEILIVDSSDDAKTPAILEKFRSERIRVIRLDKKSIPSIGRNIGAQAAREDILAFIDSDACAVDDWAENILHAVDAGCRIGGGAVLVPDEQKKNALALAQYFLQFNEFLATGSRRPKMFVPSVSLFCERKLFFEIGGFPEIRASEDVLFCIAANKKANVYFDPSIRVRHIFREETDAYLRNQAMLGKYIIIYRREVSKSWMYKGAIPALLLPGFALVKLVRMTYRILDAKGGKEAGAFLYSLPLFLQGFLYWCAGFFRGCFEKRGLKDA
jgi:glycosyltransferase involved in cell wall biosynthesis